MQQFKLFEEPKKPNEEPKKPNEEPTERINSGKREKRSSGSYCGSDEEKTRMAKNLLQVNVFFQTLNIQTITEDPKYEVKFVYSSI